MIKSAYSSCDFIDEDKWPPMLDARNEALHVYDDRHMHLYDLDFY